MSSLYAIAQTATPENASIALKNAQDGFAVGYGNAMGLTSVTVLVLIFAVLLAVLNSVHAYRWVLNASSTFAQSVQYAIKGVATAIVLSIVVAPVYLFSQLDSGSRQMVYRGIGLLIAGYIALVVLGYIGERVWQRVQEQHEAATGHRLMEDTEADAE